MTQLTPDPPVSPSAPAAVRPEPAPASAGLIIAFAFALFGIWMAINTPANVTLALRLAEVDPIGKTASYSLLAGVGTLVALLANPFFGRLSDRTRSAFGRRRPWMIVGLVGGTTGAAFIAFANSVPLMLVGWVLMQLFVNAAVASILAVIADRIPASQQGTVGGIAGMTPAASLLVGTFFVQLFPTEPALQMGIPMIGAIIFVGIFVVVLRESSTRDMDRTPFGIKEFFGSFTFNARKNPDFGWLLLSLFLIEIGVAIVLTYTVYFLQDYLGIKDTEVATVAFYANLVGNAAAVLFSFLSGMIADRIGRKKPVLMAAGIFIVIGILVIITGGRDLTTFLIGETIIGAGSGIYFGIYLGFAASTVNDPSTSARDLGLVNIANTLPFSISPFLAPLILNLGGGGGPHYLLLFAIGALVTAIGTPIPFLIRRVR